MLRQRKKGAYKYKLQTWEEMYLSGLSQPDISRLLSIPRNQIQRYLQGIGISRSISMSTQMHFGEPSKHWRAARNRARIVWRENNGYIPVGYHIHHRDHNYTNNNISNLELVKAGEHQRKHLAERTHCKNGHLIEQENIYYEKIVKGLVARRCRQCVLNRQKIYRKGKL